MGEAGIRPLSLTLTVKPLHVCRADTQTGKSDYNYSQERDSNMTIIKCALPEYWQLPESRRPKSLMDFATMFPAEKVRGLWERKITDSRSGEVLEILWAHNAVTDNGALAALKNTFNDAGSQVAPYKYLAISSDGGSTRLTSGITSGTPITSLSVEALLATIPNGTKIDIGYGTPQQQQVTAAAQANAGATSITIASYTPTANIAANTDVIPVAVPTDNPSSVSGAQYQTLATGDFAYTAGSGDGNRIVTATKTFLGASTTAGTYTTMRLSNANPIASNSVGAVLYVSKATINSTTDQTFSFIVQI